MAVSHSASSCKAANDVWRKSPWRRGAGLVPGPRRCWWTGLGAGRLRSPTRGRRHLTEAASCGDAFRAADLAQLHLRFQEQLHDILSLELIGSLNAGLEQRLNKY